MAEMSAKAKRYEAMYPGTGVSNREKEERLDRKISLARKQSGHPMRISTPGDFRSFPDSPKTCEWVEIGPGRFKRVPLTERG